MAAQLALAGGGLTVATHSIGNVIVRCMDAHADNRMRVDRQKFDHELNMESAQLSRDRDQNQHQLKENFEKKHMI